MNAQGTNIVVGGIAAAVSGGTRACALSTGRSASNWRARYAKQLYTSSPANSALSYRIQRDDTRNL